MCVQSTYSSNQRVVVLDRFGLTGSVCSMFLKGKIAVITGASMGIGAATARKFAQEGASMALIARSKDKLIKLAEELRSVPTCGSVVVYSVNLQDSNAVATAMTNAVKDLGGPVDVLINNAGLALGAPACFHDQSIADIMTMVQTNLSGVLYAAHAVLNQGGMAARKRGVILNVTSVTALEVPPFSGRLCITWLRRDRRAFRTRCRVGFDHQKYSQFMEGYEPLLSSDVADAISWVLEKPERITVKAIDVVPTAQRSLSVFDREWNSRNLK
ncbi:unnamed protein product [Phytophthora fragariaefolia]|uniref:Unnamed protein product n=1 Tax=Phytophthora fragariaefolia TaxID=1490495 RepID=A0A9W7D010_9STRA|nr:unnamed protein product [Phytophthora fragariaefolia]